MRILLVKLPELYDDLLYTHGLIRTPDFTPDQVTDLKMRDREAAIAKRILLAESPIA